MIMWRLSVWVMIPDLGRYKIKVAFKAKTHSWISKTNHGTRKRSTGFLGHGQKRGNGSQSQRVTQLTKLKPTHKCQCKSTQSKTFLVTCIYPQTRSMYISRGPWIYPETRSIKTARYQDEPFDLVIQRMLMLPSCLFFWSIAWELAHSFKRYKMVDNQGFILI